MFKNMMEEERKRADSLSKIRHICKCGHSVYVPARNRFAYCSHCDRKVFNTDFNKFEYELLSLMGKINNEQVSS